MSVAPEAVTRKRRPLWLRIIAVLCAVLTAWHIFATFLWVAPASELRSVVPSKVFYGYMNPMFNQSWSVFAPEPVNGDYLVEVRAISVDENGKRKTTEWVNAVSREMSLTHHNFFPARATLAGTQVASEYRKTWKKLGKNQQEVVEWNYYEGNDWSQRLETELEHKAGKSSSAVKNARDFIDEERKTTAYVTQVARALWGTSIEQVQYRVGRQSIVSFEKRHDPEAVRPKPSYIKSGWRGQIIVDGQNDSNFAMIFNGLEDVN